MNELRKRAFEVARFLIVGGLMTAANLVLYGILVYGLHFPGTASAAIAFLALVPVHFLSHSKFTFRHNQAKLDVLVKYALSLAITLGCNVALVYLFADMMGLPAFLSQCLALGPSLIVNFTLFRYFAFREDRDEPRA